MKYPRYPAYKLSGDEWLGEIPAHWDAPLLKYVARLKYGDSLAADSRDESGNVPVFGSNGVVGSHSSANTKSPAIIVGRKGSYGKVTYSTGVAFSIDTTYFVDSTCTDQHLRWLYYILQSVGLDTNSQDTGVPGLSREAAYSIRFIVPPLAEQTAIAAFLDQETDKIDALIAKQERLITLLQEKRQALISHVVTKGMNPDVPMKSSGIEWLGEIPIHWEVIQSRRLFGLRKSTALPSDQQLTAAQKYGVIYQDDFVEREGRRVVQVIKGGDILKHVEPNDFVISMRSFQGGIEGCRYRGSISSAYVVLIPSELVDFDYFTYLFKSEQYIQALQSTTNLVRDGQALRYGNFTLVDLPLVSLDEQKQIAVYLGEETRKIDMLIKKSIDSVNLLKERRSALISAAVTGKIDVRNLVN